MSTTSARTTNGHTINAFQPINGRKGAINVYTAAFWESSMAFDASVGTNYLATFWESSEVYVPLVYDETSSIGETICVPDPITQQDCGVKC